MDTVLDNFYRNVINSPDQISFLIKDQDANNWRSLSNSDLLKKVAALAKSLKNLGISKGDAVAIYSNTRYEWTVIDLAILSIGAVSVPIYHTLSVDTVRYILNHSKSKLLFIENLFLLEKIQEIKPDLIELEKIFIIEEEGQTAVVPSVKNLIHPVNNYKNIYESFIKNIGPDDTATYVYTSGTTGEPKGALITHANIASEVDGLRKIFRFKKDDIGLLFLPLAHVVARAMQFYQLCQGCISAYAESVEKLPQNILEIRPHFMVVVPRVMEKIYEKIISEVTKGIRIKKWLFDWSVGVGSKVSRRVKKHIPLSLFSGFQYWFVKKIVFHKLRAGLGGRLKMVISGGAPLAKETAEFFHAIGLLVIEGYGLTETMAAVTINRPDDFKFGTVGKPMEGVQMRIAADGEILVKGPQIFRGYKQPVAEIDADPFEDGWFKTGDIGEFSRDGFLRITGRKKELIVTSGGKNIIPQRVEEILRESRYIKDAVIFGDKKKYLIALIIPDYNHIAALAREKGWKFVSKGELLKKSETYQLINSEIQCKNRQLARHETVKKFAIVENDFSQEKGELTPTLKMKRKRIYEGYKDLIERLYV